MTQDPRVMPLVLCMRVRIDAVFTRYVGPIAAELCDEEFEKMSKNYFRAVVFVVLGLFCASAMAADLHDAMKAGDVVRARQLLEAGADVNDTDAEGRTPLHVAVIEKRIELVPLLLEKGANVSARTPSGDTPLHLAGRHGRPKI